MNQTGLRIVTAIVGLALIGAGAYGILASLDRDQPPTTTTQNPIGTPILDADSLPGGTHGGIGGSVEPTVNTWWLHQSNHAALLDILNGDLTCVANALELFPNTSGIDVIFDDGEFSDHLNTPGDPEPDLIADPIALDVLQACAGVPLADIDALVNGLTDGILLDAEPTHAYPEDPLDVHTYPTTSRVTGTIYFSWVLPGPSLPRPIDSLLSGDFLGEIRVVDDITGRVLGTGTIDAVSDSLVFGEVEDLLGLGLGPEHWNAATVDFRLDRPILPSHHVSIELDLNLLADALDNVVAGEIHFIGYEDEHASWVRINPFDTDLNLDGETDEGELDFGTDDDLDDDGLTNNQERNLGTDPRDPDTDGDGLTDGQEIKDRDDPVGCTTCDGGYGTDPLDPDSDNDGLSDGQEVVNDLVGPDHVKTEVPQDPPACRSGTGGAATPTGQPPCVGTDPLDPDTDDGGVDDGTEVLIDGTEPVQTPQDDFNKERWFLHQRTLTGLEAILQSVLSNPTACVTAPGSLLGGAIDLTLLREAEFMDHINEWPPTDAEPDLVFELLSACLGVPLVDIEALLDSLLPIDILDATPTHQYLSQDPDSSAISRADMQYVPGSVVEGEIYLSLLLPDDLVPQELQDLVTEILDTLEIGGPAFEVYLEACTIPSAGIGACEWRPVGGGELTIASDTLVYGELDDLLGDFDPTNNWNELPFKFETTGVVQHNDALRFNINMDLLRNLLPTGSLHFIGYNTEVDTHNVPGSHASNFRLCPAITGVKRLDADDDGIGETPQAGVVIYSDENGNGAWDHEPFQDTNQSGTHEEGEPFTDTNGNGQWDAEPHDVTDANGRYTIVVTRGQHTIREVPPPGQEPSHPAAGHYVIGVGTTHTVLSGFNFVNRFIPDSISGLKCNDINLDGRCNNLAPHIVWVVDASGSTEDAFPVGTGQYAPGDVNGDGIANSILDAEVQAILTTMSLVEATGVDWQASLIVFGDGARQVDFDLDDTNGVRQLRTSSLSELTAAATQLRVCDSRQTAPAGSGCGTNFELGFARALDALEGRQRAGVSGELYPPTSVDNANVILLSDGLPNRGDIPDAQNDGTEWRDDLENLVERGVGNLRAFGFEIQGASSAQKLEQAAVMSEIDPSSVIIPNADRLFLVFEVLGVVNVEQGLSGFVIWVDRPRAITASNPTTFNLQRDADEPFDVTGADGEYEVLLTGLAPNTQHLLCEQQQFNWQQTWPVVNGEPACYAFITPADPATSFIRENVNFANHFVPKGVISGFKCNDLDRDGVCDNANPHTVFVIDVSGSTEDQFEGGGGDAGDFNLDGLPNTVMDAQLVAFSLLAINLREQFGDAAEVSIVLFGEEAVIVDVDPETAGFQTSLALSTTTQVIAGQTVITDSNLHDLIALLQEVRAGGVHFDGPGTLDDHKATGIARPDGDEQGGHIALTCDGSGASTCHAGFGTNYEAALLKAIQAVDAIGSTPGNVNVLFASDGEPNVGGAYTDEALTLHGLADNVRAYGIGSNAKLPALQIIDEGAAIFTRGADLSGAIRAGVQADAPLPGIRLYIDLNDNGQRDTGEPTTVTRADGTWTFSGLNAGTYIVREDLPSSVVQTAPAAGYFVVTVPDAATRVEVDVEGQPLHFANYLPGPGTLVGFKCEDLNANGVCEAGEPGLAGFTVYLDLNNNGVLDANEPSTTTSSTGHYAFPPRAPGTFRVCQVVPAGVEQTAPGGDLCHENVLLPPDSQTSVPNFADRFLTGAVLGFKCLDQDGGGTCDDGEPGLGGFTVFLDANGNGQLDAGEPRLVTDASGHYHFVNMAPGTYRVCQVVEAGYIQTAPGGDGCWEDIPVERGAVTLPPHFADRIPQGGLRVHTCVDTDRDTTCDTGEAALPGIQVGGPGLAPGTTGPAGDVFYPGLSVGAHEVCVQTVPITMEVTGSTCKDGVVPTDGEGYVEFTLAFLPSGTVTGYKCQDNNGNGVCDQLLLGDAPNVVYIIDVSGSTVDLNTPFEGDEDVGDVNSDTISNSILDAELAAYIGLTQDLIDREVGDRSQIGIVVFSGQPLDRQGPAAAFLDMDPSTPGRQATTNAGADNDASGVPDVMEILRRIVGIPNGQQMSDLTAGTVTQDFGQFTNFEAGLQSTISLLQAANLANEETNVLFLSDGKPNRPSGIEGQTSDYVDEVETLRDLAGNVRAFGVGEQTELGTLVVIDPAAEIFLRTSELLGLFTGVGEDRQDADPPLPRVTVFADLNGNGVLDVALGEPWTLTRPSGLFTLLGVPISPDDPFTRRICEIVPPGYTQTAPGTQCWSVRVEANGIVSAPDFADQPTGDLDTDRDGIEFRLDNCPLVANPGQQDTDGNGLGDACDQGYGGISDIDMDGVPDEDDAFPGDPSEWADADGDGIGDNADLDDDNNGILDSEEVPGGGGGGVIVQKGPLLIEEPWFWVGVGMLAAILIVLVAGVVAFARARREETGG